MTDTIAGAVMHPGLAPSADALPRRTLLREFFLGIKRGLLIGRCGSCETFYLMAKLCLQEDPGWLSDEERRDLASWVEAGTVVDLDTGCEDACGLVRLYSRLSR